VPLSADDLRSALLPPLPGHAAFALFTGYPRPSVEEALALDPPPRESAVLIAVHAADGKDRTLLMQRPVYDGVHSGQIGFPGGKREPGDADLHATALREFAEETGADVSHFMVVGELSRIHIPPSHTIVTPVVAWCESLGPLRPDPREVVRLLDIPLSELLREDILKHRPMMLGLPQREFNVAYWELMGQVVWGATAMMVAELRAVLRKAIRPAI
jgi:8-oxo-dGTP pyrophosphatase MutT (NUDIX family)